MKKLLIIPLLAMLLAGCGGEKTMETISDVQAAPVAATMQRVQLQLPPELSAPALQSQENGTLYLCDDYSVTVQTVDSGDLQKTVRNVTGMDMKDLQLQTTRKGDAKCYQWVWTTNGENGIQVGRGCVLDDGSYHYVLTAMADEAVAGQVQPAWREIFASFCLATEREDISTGS